MVNFGRFQKLDALCDKSKEKFSSVKGIQELFGEEEDIISNSGNEPLDDSEIVLINIILDNAFLRFIEFLTEVDTENIKLNDEELEFLEEKYDTWEAAISIVEE